MFIYIFICWFIPASDYTSGYSTTTRETFGKVFSSIAPLSTAPCGTTDFGYFRRLHHKQAVLVTIILYQIITIQCSGAVASVATVYRMWLVPYQTPKFQRVQSVLRDSKSLINKQPESKSGVLQNTTTVFCVNVCGLMAAPPPHYYSAEVKPTCFFSFWLTNYSFFLTPFFKRRKPTQYRHQSLT